jgi:hypothetical protein
MMFFRSFLACFIPLYRFFFSYNFIIPTLFFNIEFSLSSFFSLFSFYSFYSFLFVPLSE